MTIPLWCVDAFTKKPFGGNPAAVCLLPAARDERWMASLAGEMNLSETAFLVRRTDGGYDLRWFTPKVEVELCGHATLASAHALWNEAGADRGRPLRFHTKSGVLTCVAAGDRIEMDFPAKPPEAAAPPPELLRALGVKPFWVGRNKFDYLVEVGCDEAVREAAPDFAALRQVPVRGVIVTAASSEPGCDFVSRFFAPAAGVDEDPVTGSAHCCLAPYWGRKLEKREMVGFQASTRGGTVLVRLEGDRVVLGGQAVTVYSAILKDAR
jgi:PhzF family phenazine biosynthesis protein